MTRSEAETMIANIKDMAATVLQNDGYHAFMALAYCGSLGTVIDLQQGLGQADDKYDKGDISGGQDEKVRLAKNLRKFVKEKGFDGIILIGETWISTNVDASKISVMHGDEPGKSVATGPLARFDKNRREALSVAWEFKLDDGSKMSGGWLRFFRHEGKKIVIEEESLSGSNAAGLFTDLIN